MWTRTTDQREVILAYGAGSFRPRRGPVKGLRIYLAQHGVDIRLVNENYTSQLCFCCHEFLDLVFDESGKFIYEIKKCENRECPVTFIHRDKNATRNIDHIFKAEILGERPEKFTAKYYKQKRKAAAEQAEQAEQNRLMGATAGHDTLDFIDVTDVTD